MFRSVVGSLLLALGIIGAAISKASHGKIENIPMGLWLFCLISFVSGIAILTTKSKVKTQNKKTTKSERHKRY